MERLHFATENTHGSALYPHRIFGDGEDSSVGCVDKGHMKGLIACASLPAVESGFQSRP